MEGNAHGAEEESCILVGSGGSVEDDIATGDHFGGVPIFIISHLTLTHRDRGGGNDGTYMS